MDKYFTDIETARRAKALDKVGRHYLKGYTCRETCEHYGITYSRRIQKIFHLLWPKGLGWGGARKGSGNKPGSNGWS